MPEWGAPFLANLQLRGSISAACKAVGVGRRTVYDERARNPLFDEMMREAGNYCVEEVEATLYQRAVSGGSMTDRQRRALAAMLSSAERGRAWSATP